MMTGFFRKNEIKQKNDILRGVYEENLKIIGKGRGGIARTRPFFLRKTFLTFLLAMTALLLHGIFSRYHFPP